MPRDPAKPSNPFQPGFGKMPPVVVGRARELDAFLAGLEEGSGAIERAMLISGTRGMGKTTLLREMAEEAAGLGWMVLFGTARPGMTDEFSEDRLPELLALTDAKLADRKLTGGQISTPLGGGNVATTVTERYPRKRMFESRLRDLLSAMEPYETGVFVAIDELHPDTTEEVRKVTTAVQHLLGEGRNLAFAAAGLPAHVKSLLSLRGATFMRRAEHFRLGPLDDAQVASGLLAPIRDGGRTIGAGALTAAVKGVHGYPFLVQAIGYDAWRAQPNRPEVTDAAVADAIDRSVDRMRRLVIGPALADISQGDRRYLAAMAMDDGPSRTADITKRLGKKHQSVYRQRLLDAELIHVHARGFVDFVIPYLREHLRDETASEEKAAALTDDPDALLAAAESGLDDLNPPGSRHLAKRARHLAKPRE